MESTIEIVCEFLKYLINTITSMSWQIFAFFVLFIFKDSLIDFISKIKNIHAIGFSFDSDIQQQSIDSIQNNSSPSSDELSNSKPCNINYHIQIYNGFKICNRLNLWNFLFYGN